MIKKEYDVVVIGAGPGGSSAAFHLANSGLNVALLEKRQEIGVPKRCGEGLSIGSIQMIEENLGAKIPSECIAQIINGAIICAPNKKEIVIDFGKNAGAIMERKVFDKWLAIQASKAGAHVQAKTDVCDIIKENDFVTGVKAEFEGDKFDIKSKIVVAADGIESTIARKAGLNTTSKLINIDSGFQYEMSNLKIDDPHKIYLWFGNELAPRGYVWLFPKGNDIANVGVGVALTEKSAKYYLDKFIENNPVIFKNSSIVEVNAGGISVGGFLKNMVLNGLVVVGDAAHQVNPIHGGGMKEASLAGKMAADIIVRAIENNDVSQKNLSEYNQIWWDERGKKLEKVQKLREVFEKLSDDDLNMVAETLTGDDLIAFSKGNRLGVLAKILMKKPSLVKLARYLL